MQNLDDYQKELAQQIITLLLGQSFAQAKAILKAVSLALTECAVIRGERRE